MWYKKIKMRLHCIGMVLFNPNFMCIVNYKENGLKADGLIYPDTPLEEVAKYLQSRGHEERGPNDSRKRDSILRN